MVGIKSRHLKRFLPPAVHYPVFRSPLLTGLILIITLMTPGLLTTGCIYPLRDLLEARSEAINEILSHKAVYVARSHTGDELGSRSKPFRSIDPALELASELISRGSAKKLEIRAAAGTYRPDSTIRLTPGTSLRGGYSYPLWDQDPTAYETRISGIHDPVIDFAAECGRDTAVRDLVIEASARNELCAVECTGAGPVLRGITIDLRPVWNTSIGLLLSSDTALIDSNRIFAGSVTDNSWAIACIASRAEVRNNVLAAESGSGTAILLHATQNSDLEVLNNTFYLNSSGDTALFVSSSTLRFENNILAGAVNCRGIYESTAGSPSFSSLRNNEFNQTGSPLLRAADSSEKTSIAELESYIDDPPDAEASGNDAGTNPGFINPYADDFHISINPLSGLDLSAEFRYDADEILRTAPWSIGAYEYDP